MYASEDFDHFVKVLVGRLNFALELQADWPSMDGEERIAHTEDWPVNNAILLRLEEYACSHGLNEEQKAQWVKLCRLIAEHRADLEQMGYRVREPETGKGRAAA